MKSSFGGEVNFQRHWLGEKQSVKVLILGKQCF